VNLAYVGPLPPLRSGVADYGAALLPYLRPHFSRVIAVVDGYTPQLLPGLVDEVCDGRDGADWWSEGRVVPLYQMGNNTRYHRTVYQTLGSFPGVTVLHDGNLLPFIHEATLTQGDWAGFLREIGFEQGWKGTEAAWTSLRRAVPFSLHAYSLLARVARASLGVIVHSRHLRDRVVGAHPQARVMIVPHLNSMPRDLPFASRGEMKRSLGLNPDDLVIGAFGFVAPPKRLDRALEAFVRLRDEFPRARFICVGEVAPDHDFGAELDKLALGGVVQVTGYVPMETFLRYLRAVDVGVNLRYPTWGESSGTLTRLMACGVPTIVTDAGAFAELPGEAVVKVPFGAGEVTAIESALRDLLSDADRRETIGAAAREFVDHYCDPSRVAEQYVSFIRALVTDGNRACTLST
jgi:glycosyltransferase involved in cell wall biosynthesis